MVDIVIPKVAMTKRISGIDNDAPFNKTGV
jgi:hypothetical protein